MTRYLLALTLLAATAPRRLRRAQLPTQALVAFDSKTSGHTRRKRPHRQSRQPRSPNSLNLAAIPPNGAQVALLIDDGLRTSVGRE